MKNLLTTTALLVFFIYVGSSSYATRLDDLIIQKDSQLNGLLLELLIAGATLDDPRLNASSELAENICMAAGLDRSSCTYGSKRPETIAEALDMIPNEDRYWYWDQFRDQYGNTQWRCRGSQTGQFATDSQCSGVTRDDERWPGPNP